MSDIRPVENTQPLLQLTSTSPKYCPPSHIDEWRRWFHRHCTIYTAKFIDAGAQLFEYVNRIYGLHAKHPNTFIWCLYDEEFRKLKTAKRWKEWHKLDPGCLRAVEEEHVIALRKKQLMANRGNSGYNGPNGASNGNNANSGMVRFPSNGTCHHWNRGECTTKGKCRWLHMCVWCKQDHKAIVCKNKK